MAWHGLPPQRLILGCQSARSEAAQKPEAEAEGHRGVPNHRGAALPADFCCPRSPSQTKPTRVVAPRLCACTGGASTPGSPRPRRLWGSSPLPPAPCPAGPRPPGAGPAAAAGAATRGWERPRRRPRSSGALMGMASGPAEPRRAPGLFVCLAGHGFGQGRWQ